MWIWVYILGNIWHCQFLILVILMYTRSFHFNFLLSSICIILMSNEFVCFSMCLMVIFMSFVKCLFYSCILPIFKLGCFPFCYWVLELFVYSEFKSYLMWVFFPSLWLVYSYFLIESSEFLIYHLKNICYFGETVGECTWVGRGSEGQGESKSSSRLSTGCGAWQGRGRAQSHNLSHDQESATQPTEPPRCS